MALYNNKNNGHLLLKEYILATSLAIIPRWRSELRDSILVSVNDTLVSTPTEVEQVIKLFHSRQHAPKHPVKLTFEPSLKIATYSDVNFPQIHFD